MTHLPLTREKLLWRQLTAYSIFALVALLALSIVPELFAADGDEDPKVETLLDQIKNAGAFSVVLIACSVGMITLIVYNFMQLTKTKFNPDDLRLALLDHMQNCRVRSAIEVSSTSPTYLGRMMAHSLPSVDATEPETLGREAVEDQMAEFTIRENRSHMNWIGYFSILAQASPMIGLLGTVVGMMRAFAKLSETGGAQADKLAGDISLAMITTAGGLIIAIPCLFSYFFFRNRLNKLVADCHSNASEMLDGSVAAVNADQIMAKVPEGLTEA